MSGIKWICRSILAFLAVPAQAITPEQAQTLPVAELATIVLGEAGMLVVDVDRPKWPTCWVVCEPLTEEQLKQPPPLHLGLDFYTRIRSASTMENWRGLCRYEIIRVSYDESGKPSGIDKSPRWGAPNGMRRAATAVTPESMPALIEVESEKCGTGTNPRTFFASSDINGTYRALVAAALFAEAAGRGAPLPFKFKCRSDFGDCEGGGAKAVAETFRSANIAHVDQVDCAEPRLTLRSIGPDACYSVQLRADGESLFLELVDDYPRFSIKRVEYSHNMLIID